MTEKRAAKEGSSKAAKRGRWLLLALGLSLVVGVPAHASIPPVELKPSVLEDFEGLLSATALPQASSLVSVPPAPSPSFRLFEPPPLGGGFLALRRSASEDRVWAKSRVWAFDLSWEEQPQWDQWFRVKIAEGVLVERYEYSPFGERSILVDSTPPAVHQVRVVAGELWLEMSEEIRWEAFVSGVADGRVTLENVTTSASYPLEADQPVVSGRARGRRIVLRQQGTDPWPAAGDEVRLVIVGQGLIVEGDPPRPGSPLEDLFRNQPFENLVTTLTWPASDAVLSDTKAPLLEELCVVEGGFLEAQFSEPVDPALLGGEFLVDGTAMTWTAEVSGYLLRSVSGVAAGPHTFTIGTGPLDLDGKGLEEAFSGGVEVTGTEEHFVFQASAPGLVLASTIGNRLGFQGLEEEVDTGLLYVRNRWYDPQMGRFITTDPLGYVDSPSLYAGLRWRPSMVTDPMGSMGEEQGAPKIFLVGDQGSVEVEALPPPSVSLVPFQLGGTVGYLIAIDSSDITADSRLSEGLSALKLVAPPIGSRAVRITNPLVDPLPTRIGLFPSNASAVLRPAEHALNVHGLGGGGSPFISASMRRAGAEGIEGSVRLWIDIEAAIRGGAEFVSEADLRSDMTDLASDPRYRSSVQRWLRAQVGEGEVLFRGAIDPAAVDTRSMRNLRIAGRGVMVLGIAVTAVDVGIAVNTSVEERSGSPIAAEAIRQVGGWGGAWFGAKGGCAVGGLLGIETGPGAILTCIGGGVIGGFGGYFGGDALGDMIHEN